MNDQNDNRPRRQPRSSGNQDIPRRGYNRERHPRDATGQLGSTAPLPSDEPSQTRQTRGSGRYSPPPTPPPPRRGIKKERAPRDSGLYLPWWSLVILILVVGVAALGLLFGVASLGNAILIEPTAQIIVVTPQLQPTDPQANAAPPTAINGTGVDPANASVPVVTNTPILTAEPTRTPVPGGCLLNEEVTVFNTGGVGLNLRDEPGGEVQFIAKEGERLLVTDGPVVYDGLDWCLVRSVGQSSSFGWAAKDFLRPLDQNNE